MNAAHENGGQALPWPVTIRCARCRTETRMGLLGAVRRAMVSLWRPGSGHNRVMRCPACHRLSAVRIDWFAQR